MGMVWAGYLVRLLFSSRGCYDRRGDGAATLSGFVVATHDFHDSSARSIATAARALVLAYDLRASSCYRRARATYLHDRTRAVRRWNFLDDYFRWPAVADARARICASSSTGGKIGVTRARVAAERPEIRGSRATIGPSAVRRVGVFLAREICPVRCTSSTSRELVRRQGTRCFTHGRPLDHFGRCRSAAPTRGIAVLCQESVNVQAAAATAGRRSHHLHFGRNFRNDLRVIHEQ